MSKSFDTKKNFGNFEYFQCKFALTPSCKKVIFNHFKDFFHHIEYHINFQVCKEVFRTSNLKDKGCCALLYSKDDIQRHFLIAHKISTETYE
jgi:hypothetical protein